MIFSFLILILGITIGFMLYPLVAAFVYERKRQSEAQKPKEPPAVQPRMEFDMFLYDRLLGSAHGEPILASRDLLSMFAVDITIQTWRTMYPANHWVSIVSTTELIDTTWEDIFTAGRIHCHLGDPKLDEIHTRCLTIRRRMEGMANARAI